MESWEHWYLYSAVDAVSCKLTAGEEKLAPTALLHASLRQRRRKKFFSQKSAESANQESRGVHARPDVAIQPGLRDL